MLFLCYYMLTKKGFSDICKTTFLPIFLQTCKHEADGVMSAVLVRLHSVAEQYKRLQSKRFPDVFSFFIATERAVFSRFAVYRFQSRMFSKNGTL